MKLKLGKMTGHQIGSPTKHEIAQNWSWDCPEEEEEYKQFLYKLIDKLWAECNEES